MTFFKKILYKNNAYVFLVKYLLCFFVLYFFFPFYRGITAAGGKLYSPFLDNHVNLVKWFTRFLTGSARLLLQALQYNVYQKDYKSLRIGFSGGVNVNPSCLGWAVMSFWVAFVFANPGDWKHKLKWMLIGVTSICALNITRIALIALANHLHWKTITLLDHHQTFNVVSYSFILILMYVYITFQKKYEGIDGRRKQQKHKLSGI